MSNKHNKELPNLFSAKLKFYMDKAKIKSPELAKKIGVTSAAVRNWYNGERFPNDILKISDIADVLGVSMVDLLPVTHKEKKALVKKEIEENEEEYRSILPSILPDSIRLVPLVGGLVGAGSTGFTETTEPLDQIYVDIHTIDKSYREKTIQAIRVAGDSMKPYVDENDLVLFHPLKHGEYPAGDGKYIISTAHGEQVKNVKFMLNGNIRIISENSSYHTKDGYDEEIDKESQEYLTIVGKVVGRILKG